MERGTPIRTRGTGASAAALVLAASMAAVVLVASGGPVCGLRALTGLPCPTCGMTRAVASLVAGDLGRAWALHPLAFVLAPVACYGIARATWASWRRSVGGPLAVLREVRPWVWGLVAAGFAAAWALRLAGLLPALPEAGPSAAPPVVARVVARVATALGAVLQ